ncbi:hypothetical protein [Streptomyces sp. NPDC056255]|uniref:hypothetical protein n=1 Tax=Streptomyces sp. NPDC056255 TaxID=3345764 RepID=UPI0035DE6CFE
MVERMERYGNGKLDLDFRQIAVTADDVRSGRLPTHDVTTHDVTTHDVNTRDANQIDRPHVVLRPFHRPLCLPSGFEPEDVLLQPLLRARAAAAPPVPLRRHPAPEILALHDHFADNHRQDPAVLEQFWTSRKQRCHPVSHTGHQPGSISSSAARRASVDAPALLSTARPACRRCA